MTFLFANADISIRYRLMSMLRKAEHKAPWSTSLILMSSLGTLVTVGAAVILLRHAVAFSWFPITLIAICALFTVRGYTITPDAILVHRLFWMTRLPASGLVAVQAKPNAMRKSWRIFGNGGFFSFSGFFKSQELGVHRALLTDLQRTVVLRYQTRTIVVSPADPEAFVRDVG